MVSVAFADEGKLLLTADVTGALSRWDARSGAALGDVIGPSSPVDSPIDAHSVVGPDDRTAASFANGFGITLLDVATGRVQRVIQPELGPQPFHVRQVLGWADGTSLVIRTAGAVVPGVWARVSTATGELVWSVDAPEDVGAPEAVVVDGATVVLGESGQPHFLDAVPGDRAAATSGEPNEQTNYRRSRTWRPGALALSPDGGTLAAVSPAGTVTLWDTATRQIRGTLAATGMVTAVYRPDGDLVTISSEGTVWVYDLDPTTLLEEACAKAGRDLTEAEWASLVPDQPYRSVCPRGASGS
jgi:WD40 repeat protein